MIDHLNTVKANIESKVAKEKKHPKVLILMGIPGSYLVATDQSYIGDLVKIAGEKMSFKITQSNIFLRIQSTLSTSIQISY